MKFEEFEFNPVEDKELGVTDYVLDAFAAPVRGLEGLAHGVYNLGDFLSFDMLPDWDEQRLFGRSETLPGQLIESIAQFAVPFGVISKGISLAGKATKAGKIATTLTKGKKTGYISDLNTKGFFTASMASDFVAFDGQEQRLSNLIQQFPELQNPVTEYLEANPDDNELVGRLKNVIEGVLLEAGMVGVAKPFLAGVNAIKNRATELQKGANKADATTTAMMKWQDDTRDLDVADLPDFRAIDDEVSLIRDIEIDKKAIADEQKDLDEILKKEAKGEPIDEWMKGLRQDRVKKFTADLKRNEEKLDRLKARKSFEEQPELQEKLEDLDVDIQTWDLEEVLEDRIPPFKSYDQAGRLDLQPRGVENIKDAWSKLETFKKADRTDIEDIRKFMTVMGERLFEDVAKPSFANDIPGDGRYVFGSNLLKIRQSAIDEGRIKRTAIHELWHSLSRYLPEEDLTKLTKEFQRERDNYIKSFGIEFEEGVDPASLLKRELPDELRKFLEAKPGGFNSRNYRFKDIDEYFAEEMTDAWFKKSDELEAAPKTRLQKIAHEVAMFFKDMFISLKSKLGIDQRQKIFNDFLQQRNVTIQRQSSLRPDGMFAELPEFKPSGDVVDRLLSKIDVSKLTVGGRQSLTGLARSVSELPDGMYIDDLTGLMDALTEKIIKSKPKELAKMTKDNLDEGAVNEFADAFGSDGQMVNGLLKQSEKDRTTLFRVASRMKALETLLTENGKEIIRTAEKFKADGKKMPVEEAETLEARLRGLLEQQLHIQANASGLASGFGRGLKSRQMGVRMGLSPNEIANQKLRQDYLNKRGSMTIDEIVENILLAKDKAGDDVWNAMINLNKINRGTEGGKLTKMVEEYYKNSLMWGPRTLTINAMGTGLSAMMKQFERNVGGFLSGNPNQRRAAIHSWSTTSEMSDLLRFMLKAWKSGDHYIGDARSAFAEQSAGSVGSITARNVEEVMGKQIESDSVKGFIDFMGNLIRFPNRFNTSVDQMYKFYEYRSRAKSQLINKAINELGITDPEELGTYVTDSLNALVTRSNRNFSEANLIKEANETFKNEKFNTPADREKAIYDYVEQTRSEKLEIARRSGLIEEGLDDYNALDALTRDWIDPSVKSAEEVTFSGELGKIGRGVQNVVGSVPYLGFIVAPFVRTPTNILKFAFSRVGNPAVIGANVVKYGVSKEYRKRVDDLWQRGLPATENARLSFIEQLKAVKPDGTPDYLKRAEARGKMATGVIMNTALMAGVFAFKDRINGGGPKDYKQRQAWQAAGNMPYSIKVGDKWISYQRLDPIASMIGIYADMVDLLEDNKLASISTDNLGRVFAAMGVTLARNATNKSYLSGIDKFMDVVFNPEGTTLTEYAGSVTAGFIPNIFNQGQSIAGDMEMKETRGFWDMLQKRIPGVSEALDVKRNILGEPVVQEYFEGVAGIVNPLNPIMWGGKANDEVLFEIARVGHGFTTPSTKLDGLIELTEYEQSNGRSAHDRWMELHSQVRINGMTLRQALAKLIKNKQYQALDDKSFSGLPSPRVKYLGRIINRYRAKAKQEMLNEFPEIKQLQREVKISKKAGRTEDVLELLAQ